MTVLSVSPSALPLAYLEDTHNVTLTVAAHIHKMVGNRLVLAAAAVPDVQTSGASGIVPVGDSIEEATGHDNRSGADAWAESNAAAAHKPSSGYRQHAIIILTNAQLIKVRLIRIDAVTARIDDRGF
ncbi:hypothetical protein ES703_114728 [subsurface metagenome]